MWKATNYFFSYMHWHKNGRMWGEQIYHLNISWKVKQRLEQYWDWIISRGVFLPLKIQFGVKNIITIIWDYNNS